MRGEEEMYEEQDGAAKSWDPARIFGIVLVVGLLALFIGPNFLRARALGKASDCMTNLHTMSDASEKYTAEHAGKPPTELTDLVPKYLAGIPKCPAAGEITYRLQSGADAEGNEKKSADFHEIRCTGSQHEWASLSGDYPRYNNVLGGVRSPGK